MYISRPTLKPGSGNWPLSVARDAEQLVKDIVARTLEDQARFIAGVRKGIEQAARGELVEHKDVLNRIDRLL